MQIIDNYKKQIKGFPYIFPKNKADLDLIKRTAIIQKSGAGIEEAPTLYSARQNRGTVNLSYPEIFIVIFYSFALGFFLGASHVQGVLKSDKVNLLIEQVSEYLFYGAVPAFVILLMYFYSTIGKKRNG